MAVIVTATFRQLEQAHRAYERLIDSGIAARQIESQVRIGELDDAYDPIGAAKLFGTDLLTLSTNGRDLVGNSTTIDPGLEEFVAVFQSLDPSASSDDLEEGDETALDLAVRVPDSGTANRVIRILEEHGAEEIEFSPA